MRNVISEKNESRKNTDENEKYPIYLVETNNINTNKSRSETEYRILGCSDRKRSVMKCKAEEDS